jgi:hypothetical protein
MDAASYVALSAALGVGLPSALEAAILELERTRMLREDEAQVRVRLLNALDHVVFCTDRALLRHEMDAAARFYVDGANLRSARELQRAGVISDDESDEEPGGAVEVAADEVADDEVDAMEDE